MIHALPAFIALMIKLWILWSYRDKMMEDSFVSRMLLCFLGLLSLHNLAEIGVYTVEQTQIRVWLMDGWYTFAILSIACAAFFTSVILSEKAAKYLCPIFILIGLSLAIAVSFTDLVVLGYQENGNAMTKIAGPYYALYQIFAVAMCLVMIFSLALGAMGSNYLKKVRSVAMMLGLLPFVSIIISVLISQHLGSRFHAGSIAPIPITFFLWVLAHVFFKDELLNPLALLPFGVSNKKLKFVIELLKEKKQPEPLKPQLKRLEEILIEDAVVKSKGVQKQAADALGVSAAKISNSMKLIRRSQSSK